MITAQKARELVAGSDAHVNKQLEQISVKITEAANLGKSNIILDYVLPHEQVFKVEKEPFYPAAFNPNQDRLKTKLEESGYLVKIIEQKHDGRGGLGCMDEDPQPFSTYHIQVSW